LTSAGVAIPAGISVAYLGSLAAALDAYDAMLRQTRPSTKPSFMRELVMIVFLS
jgi:hypothetical protein